MIDWSLIASDIAAWSFRLLYLGIIIGTIVVVVLDNRNPVKTLAWVMVLTFLPFIGLLFYIFFGRSRRRERIISKRSYDRMLQKPRAEYLSQEPLSETVPYARLIDLFKHINQSFPFEGNRITTFTAGCDMIASLLHQLQQAKHHIHIQFYIFENDSVGRQVSEVLKAKALSGVEVRVIYDDVGSWKVSGNFFDDMRRSGVEVRGFLKVRFPIFTSKVNYRNHRKIVVIDGKIGFVGGMNLAERYVKGCDWGVWRDTHWMIEGKAVHGLQTVFLLDWYFADRTLLTSSAYFPKLEAPGHSIVQIVTGEPIGSCKDIMQGLLMAFAQARKYIYLQTPYFLPTESVMVVLQTAALSGVDVRLMLPQRTDSRLTQLGSDSYLSDALRAGVKVYLYTKGFLHSKMMVIDDELSTVGSTNIDFRSFEHNFEVNAFAYDADTACRMRDIFLTDQRDCRQLHLKVWQKRSWHKKMAESIVRLLAPLL